MDVPVLQQIHLVVHMYTAERNKLFRYYSTTRHAPQSMAVSSSTPSMHLAAFAAVFAKPFWVTFRISADQRQRRIELPHGETITETLEEQQPTFNRYPMVGVASLERYEGSIAVSEEKKESGSTQLIWSVDFLAQQADAVVYIIDIFASTVTAMTDALNAKFEAKSEAGALLSAPFQLTAATYAVSQQKHQVTQRQ